jgi:hypothetical protein
MSLQHPMAVARAVFGLNQEQATDAGLAGHKAANLARLTALGFPIPPGVVVSTDAVDRVRAQGGVPEDLGDRLALALEELGGGPMAVRSSGAAEDLPGASFAGQYESILRVEGLAAIQDAVLRCVQSAGSERVAAYAAGRVGDTGPAGPRMAVLVQVMVPAEAAGVAFTADPVTGDRGEVLVSAIRGLGERLVGGQATPEEGGSGTGRPTGWPGPRGPSTPRPPPGSTRWPRPSRRRSASPRTWSGRSPPVSCSCSRPGRSRPCRAHPDSSRRPRGSGRRTPSTIRCR